ncbi:MAG: restriction endonuclease [Hyphomicrobium sp.]
MSGDKTIWGIHLEYSHGSKPVDQNFVAIGWAKIGDLSKLSPNRDAFKSAFVRAYPTEKPGAVPVKAGVLFRFAVEMRAGDYVTYPSKADRMVNFGVIEGNYSFEPGADPNYPHRHRVKWLKHIPRTAFSQSALYEIGSAVTLFQVTSHAEEFMAAFEGNGIQAEELTAKDVDEDSAGVVSAQVEESTEDFIIKRLKNAQTAYQFEHFIAHLLTCMGYHASVTKASGDGGVDIIAHKDELGFEPPIIKVQCKQILDTIGRPLVQQLHGAIEHGEHGLFVTLGNYSSDARTFERTKPNLRLVDGEGLIRLIFAHYHQFEPRYQMLLPLKRMYVPGPVVTGGDT